MMKFNPNIFLIVSAAFCGSNATNAETTSSCEDTLAQSPSPIKECDILLQSFACGSEMFGTNVDDVCKRTCGLCNVDSSEHVSEGGMDGTTINESDDKGSTLDDVNNAVSSEKEATPPDFTVRLNPEFATLEYTDFKVTKDFVEMTTHVPKSTDWFGFHFFTYLSVPGDEAAALGYTFKIKHDAMDPQELIAYRTFWLNFFGPTDDVVADLGITSPVWECPADAAGTTDVCDYDEDRAEGDFMVGSGSVTLGMRPQPPGLEDIEITSAELLSNGFYKIVWRRSRYAPFDGEKINVRYASAPMELVGAEGVPAVLGYKYHGAANRFTNELPLASDASSNSVEIIDEDGFVQHKWLPGDSEGVSNVLEIGGSYGWLNPPPGAEKFADTAVNSAVVLRFNYVGFQNVALLPSLSAFEACDVSEAQVVGGNFDSPFDLNLEEYEVGEVLYIVTSVQVQSAANMQPTSCKLGMKFKVTIIGEESDIGAEAEDSVGSESLSGNGNEVEDSAGPNRIPENIWTTITLVLVLFFCWGL